MSRDEQDFDEPQYEDYADGRNALDVLHEAILKKKGNICRNCINLENTMLTCIPPVLVYTCRKGIKKEALKETYEGKRECEHFVRKNDEIRVLWE